MKKNILVLTISLLLGFGCVGWASADTVRLAWDANTVDHDLAAVQVYRAGGTCAVTSAFVPVKTFAPLAVMGTVLVSVIGTYCFAITYRDTSGNESGFSNAVQATVTCPYRHARCVCLAQGGHWNGTLKLCQ